MRRLNCHTLAIVLLLLCAAIIATAKISASGDFQDRRVSIGVRIFRALLAADQDIVQKAGNDGSLRLCLLYDTDPEAAHKAALAIRNRDDIRIRDKEVRLDIVSCDDFVHQEAGSCAGAFLTQAVHGQRLTQIIGAAEQHNIILFSPFEGDVERGVQSGLAVEAKVRPYVNLDALHQAGVRLKPFFLKVAKLYD